MEGHSCGNTFLDCWNYREADAAYVGGSYGQLDRENKPEIGSLR